MAARQIDIVVKVQNLATRPLADVEKAVRNTGKAVDQTNRDLVQFNKTLFSATAFFGTFKRAAVGVFTGLEQGANFDRLANQFESLFGESSIGEFKKNLKGMSDTAIDTVEAMRSAISLNQLGIKKDLGTISKFLSQAGVAAKMAGLNSAVGVREMTEFMKDGSVSHLQHLNLISNTNAELQAGLSITMHSNKLLGAMLTTQEKLGIAQALLNKRTKDNMKGNRDLADSFEEVKSSLNLLKLTSFTFIGKSVRPLVDNFAKLVTKLSDFTLNLRLTLPEGSTFVKMLFKAVTASGALIAALGGIKLSMMALGSLGFGVPRLVYLFGGLLAFLWGTTAGAKTLTERFGLLGKALESIAQLVESFFDPKHLGIGEVLSDIYDKLPEGLKSTILFMSRAFAVLKTFAKDTKDFIFSIADYLDQKFGGVISKITDFLKSIDKPWDIKLIDPNVSKEDKIKRWLKVATVLAGAFVGLKFVGGLLSGVPLVGKLFGGGRKPDGTRSNPIHVVAQGAFGLGQRVAGGLGGLFGLSNIIKPAFWKSMLGAGGNVLRSILGVGFQSLIRSAIPVMMAAITNPIGAILAGLAVFFAPEIIGAISGLFKSLPNLWEGFKTLTSGVGDFASAIWDVYLVPAWEKVKEKISNWWEGSSIKWFFDKIGDFFSGIWEKVKANVAERFGISSEAVEGFFGKTVSGKMSSIGEALSQKALDIRGAEAEVPKSKIEAEEAVKQQYAQRRKEEDERSIKNLIEAQQSSIKIDPNSVDRQSLNLMLDQNSLLKTIVKNTEESGAQNSSRR